MATTPTFCFASRTSKPQALGKVDCEFGTLTVFRVALQSKLHPERSRDRPANQPKTGNGGKDDVALHGQQIGLFVLEGGCMRKPRTRHAASPTLFQGPQDRLRC